MTFPYRCFCVKWLDGVNGVADHAQRLEGDHHFVILNVVADEHEYLFCRHKSPHALPCRVAAKRTMRLPNGIAFSYYQQWRSKLSKGTGR